MKYAITGAAGNISRLLAAQLLQAGHTVRIIGRNAGHLKALAASGAEIVTGSLEDAGLVKKAFAGMDAVYTMFPPNYATADLKGFNESIAENYVRAIAAGGVPYVVNLSSTGAHLPSGTGPVAALHAAETALNTLEGAHILHLRPAWFYQNLLATIGMIKSGHVMGNNFSVPAKRFPLAAAADIAEVAAQALQQRDFSGHTVRYIASDETGTAEIAAAIGKAIGYPSLPWVPFSDEALLQGLLQQGLPAPLAAGLVELGQAIHSGRLLEDYWQHRPAQQGRVKLEDFARVFADAYRTN